jgi:lipoprotein-anchoring transpeptidase ErfK/SrfK
VLLRSFVPTGAVVCALLIAAAPAQAQERRVAQGVSAGGVDLSNLTLAEAQAKLESALTPVVGKTLVLGVAGRPFSLHMRTARLKLDALLTAKRALYAPPAAAAPEGGGAVVGTVPVALSHSRLAVRAFVRKVAGRVYRAPRNATIRIGLRKISVRRSRYGYALDRKQAEKAIDAALDDPAAPRILHQRVSRVRAAVNADDLRRSHYTVVTIDKANFKLRLFKGFKVVRTYPIAHGLPAYPTPSGRFAIQNKQINPVWSVPNSPWAGELAGGSVAGGSAANPLKARWMGIANGVGIHGTGQDWSIGSRASHGCIRMHVWHVKALYRRVPVGTPVLIR